MPLRDYVALIFLKYSITQLCNVKELREEYFKDVTCF
jgi:hypothetical protein